jgi:hypothetical protein
VASVRFLPMGKGRKGFLRHTKAVGITLMH